MQTSAMNLGESTAVNARIRSLVDRTRSPERTTTAGAGTLVVNVDNSPEASDSSAAGVRDRQVRRKRLAQF